MNVESDIRGVIRTPVSFVSEARVRRLSPKAIQRYWEAVLEETARRVEPYERARAHSLIDTDERRY